MLARDESPQKKESAMRIEWTSCGSFGHEEAIMSVAQLKRRRDWCAWMADGMRSTDLVRVVVNGRGLIVTVSGFGGVR